MSKMRLMSTAEVASELGITPRHVARRVSEGSLEAEGKLPGTTGAYLFDADYIESIAAKERAATDGTRALAANTQEVA